MCVECLLFNGAWKSKWEKVLAKNKLIILLDMVKGGKWSMGELLGGRRVDGYDLFISKVSFISPRKQRLNSHLHLI